MGSAIDHEAFLVPARSQTRRARSKAHVFNILERFEANRLKN
jgi:hypothetical protein